MLSARYRTVTIGVVAVITLVAFEGIAIATAMPVAAAALQGLQIYSWAFAAYVVTSLVGMVVSGVRCDRAGPRLPMMLGVVLFGAGAAVAGLAPTMGVLVLGRAGQGFGGGALIVAVYVLIARAYAVADRPRAFALISAAWVLPALVGPFIAGWLADNVSWRAVFLLVPVVVALPAALLFPVLRRYDGGEPGADGRGRVRAGVVAAAGLALIQDGLLRLDAVGAAEALVGAGLLVPALRRLLPPRALRFGRGLPTTVMMRGILAGAFFAGESFVPLALIEQRGVSTTAAGLTLTVAALGWTAGSFGQSRLAGDRDRSGLVRLGAVLIVLSLVGMTATMAPAVPVWFAGVAWTVGALGMGLAFPSLAVQTLRLSPPEQQGFNSSALQLSDSTWSVVSLAVAGAVHAAAVAAGGATATTYVAIWLIAAALAAVGAVLAGRMRPRSGGGTGRDAGAGDAAAGGGHGEVTPVSRSRGAVGGTAES